MRSALLALVACLASATADGANPVRGRALYLNDPPALQLGCFDCHGNLFPAFAANNPGVIAAKIASPGTSGMNYFQGRLSPADIEDIAAYIGDPGLASVTSTNAALNVIAGWNLVGNSSSAILDVVAAFGDAGKVTTVWKWIAASAKWAFYAPSLVGQALADHAARNGYDVLATIAGGEGFWVNAKAPFTGQLPGGTPVTSPSFQTMPQGWNLISIADNKTPSQFSGVVNVTTLWAWDAAQANWYFYAPSLGGTALADFISSKGYLDFTAGNRSLGAATGFWVNKP